MTKILTYDNPRRVVFDIETDGLDPSVIWVVVAKDVDTGEKFTFSQKTSLMYEEVRAFFSRVSTVIGHNIIGFDLPVLGKLAGIGFRGEVIDTLVLSRLVDAGKFGGHSLDNLSKMFPEVGSKVKVHKDDWYDGSKLDLFIERGEQDIEIQYALWKHLERFYNDPDWRASINLEHFTMRDCEEVQRTGFHFNIDEALSLEKELTELVEGLEHRLQDVVPQKCSNKGEVKLRRKQDGEPYKTTAERVGDADFVDGASFWSVEFSPFNPRSSEQRVRFLNSCGWEPVEKTKGHYACERALKRERWLRSKGCSNKHKLLEFERKLEMFREFGWKVSEKNLDTLSDDAPEAAHLLVDFLILDGRLSDLKEWIGHYNQHTGRIHGTIKHIGSWTHRMAHSNPNTGNIFSAWHGEPKTRTDKAKSLYDTKLRALWSVPKGKKLLGVDAAGIQLRILAHYINNEEYSYAVCEGRKEEGSDIHSVNARILGGACGETSRDTAKTFIYAWLLGAGNGEVGRILGVSASKAKRAVDQFLSSIKGLGTLKRRTIPAIAKARFFTGLDGRKVIVPSEHHVLAGLLQNGEAVVMKKARFIWKEKIDQFGLDARLVAIVHDEWQIECSEKDVEKVAEIVKDSIRQAGEELNLNVPLEGEANIADNWAGSH